MRDVAATTLDLGGSAAVLRFWKVRFAHQLLRKRSLRRFRFRTKLRTEIDWQTYKTIRSPSREFHHRAREIQCPKSSNP